MPKNRRRSEPRAPYASYIHKVMKQLHPELQISSKAVTVANYLIEAVLKDLTKNAARITVESKKGTLSSRHVQTAVRIVLPAVLAKHATSEGTKAVTKFSTA